MADQDALTLWHEAGHAVVATLLGGQVDVVSIEPEDDIASGLTRVAWRKTDQRTNCLNDIRVSLAGPVVEMVFVGDYDFLRIETAHEADWAVIAHCLRQLQLSPTRATALLEQTASELYQWVRTEPVWAAIGDVVDRLEIDGTLDGETVKDLVSFWQRQ